MTCAGMAGAVGGGVGWGVMRVLIRTAELSSAEISGRAWGSFVRH